MKSLGIDQIHRRLYARGYKPKSGEIHLIHCSLAYNYTTPVSPITEVLRDLTLVCFQIINLDISCSSKYFNWRIIIGICHLA